MIRAKNILVLGILLLLFLPLLQQTFVLFPLKPLKGAYTLPGRPEFSFRQYFTSEFQESYNNYLEQRIGFRPVLVRINNQVAFTLFRMALANAVIIGKHHYLYEENYIKAYTGTDFQGKEKWDGFTYKLKYISDYLESKGTYLIVVFAPGKGTYFPEYIPERFLPDSMATTNCGYLLDKLGERNIRILDFNRYFVQQKHISPYPLYPKTGIHWSNYGEALALDSIISMMEHLKNRGMTDFGWSEVIMSSDLQTPDDDIGEGMNLLFPISHYAMPYPRFYFREDSSTYKPVVITVTDSYYWNLHGRGIPQRIYEADKFWYYFQTAHGPYPKDQLVKDLDILGELISADFVILMATDANLYKFDFGFTDTVYDLITAQDRQADTVREEKIRQLESVIRNDPNWMEVIRKKAEEWNKTVEEVIRMDATWMVDHEKDK